jgi:hypothetical protein
VTAHTGALNVALAEALNHALTHHADEVDIRIAARGPDGRTPTSFNVTVWHDDDNWSATAPSAITALDQAMGQLRAATGGAA